MTRCACTVLSRTPPAERLPGLDDPIERLYAVLAASCEPSGRATVDLAEIALSLRLRDLTWRIALLSLRLAGRVHVEHSKERFETATIMLPPVEINR